MCGIAGMFNLDGQEPASRNLLERMNQVQSHRGPDEGAVWLEQGVGLAHRRLAIIDISSGQQPLVSRDGQAVIVFNGEIYNFLLLRQELGELGHQFTTHSDTEVILAAYAQWGEACVEHLRGMFAFAIWDLSRQQLFLARDRLGIKPLYYSLVNGQSLIFGSELKALMQHPQLDRRLDESAIEDYFAFGYIPDPKSIYAGVAKLAPGHTLLIRQGDSRLQLRQYWDASFANPHQDSRETLQQELLERLREAVDVRLMAEVPLGAFLSGGVDSSAVVAMMAGLQDKPVNTCSIGFDVRDFNETEYARSVAEHYRTEHQERVVASDDFELLGQLSGLYDEPFADSSAIPTYRVCELARERVIVCLSGDGGDELFAGYRRHRWHMNEEKIRQMLPASLRAGVFGTLGRWYPKLDWAPKFLRAKTTFQALARDSIQAYLHSVSVVAEPLRRQLFNPAFQQRLQGYRADQVFADHAANFDGEDPLSLVQYLDMKTYLPGDILTKVDRASMAHSLEVRVPLLDHPLLEWANRIPAAMKLEGGQGKMIFKQSLTGHLSEEVLYRDKMGFAVPLSAWFRGPLKDRLRRRLLNGALRELDIFDMTFVERLVEGHISGLAEHSAVLWSLMMFEAFVARELGMPSELAA